MSAQGTIQDVIARMEAIDRELPAKDGVAYFNRLYLEVTKGISAGVAGSDFQNAAWLDRLDVIFAGLYFEAEATVDSGAKCPPSWRPLISERKKQHQPIQFALAGMSAHINHDLAVAVVQTCTEQGIELADDSPEHKDFQAVNTILSKVETQVAAWFKRGLIGAIEDVLPTRVDNALAMWSMVAARDLAWDHARVIWRLRDDPHLSADYLKVLARTTEMAAAAMLA